MIVKPTLLDHPKYLRLVRRLGADALPVLLRLWGHCEQDCRGGVWADADAEYVEMACHWEGQPQVCFSALVECGFVNVKDGVVSVHDWDEVNTSLVSAWSNGRKGGRPRRARNTPTKNDCENPPDNQSGNPPDNQSGNPEANLGKPVGEPIRGDKSRVENTPCSPPPGDTASGNSPLPSPPVLIDESRAREWFRDMVDHGASFQEEDFVEAFRLLHSTRDISTGSWKIGKRGLVSDPRVALELRLADAARRREERSETNGGSRAAYVLQTKADALERTLADHRGKPGGPWPSHVQEACYDDFVRLSHQLKTVKAQLGELTHA